jgi:hypothetical protein
MAIRRCDASAAGCVCILTMGHAGQHRAQGDIWGWWDGQVVNGEAATRGGGPLLPSALNLSAASGADVASREYLDKAAAGPSFMARMSPAVEVNTAAMFTRGPGIGAPVTSVGTEQCGALFIATSGVGTVRCPMAKGHDGPCVDVGKVDGWPGRATKSDVDDHQTHADVVHGVPTNGMQRGDDREGCGCVWRESVDGIASGQLHVSLRCARHVDMCPDAPRLVPTHVVDGVRVAPKLWAIEQAEADADAIAERRMRAAIVGPVVGIEETRARLRAVLERNKHATVYPWPEPKATPAPVTPRPGQTWRDAKGEEGVIVDSELKAANVLHTLRMASGLRVVAWQHKMLRPVEWTYVSGPTAPETPREAFERVLALCLADRPDGVTEMAWLRAVGEEREGLHQGQLIDAASGRRRGVRDHDAQTFRAMVARRREAMVASEAARRKAAGL